MSDPAACTCGSQAAPGPLHAAICAWHEPWQYAGSPLDDYDRKKMHPAARGPLLRYPVTEPDEPPPG